MKIIPASYPTTKVLCQAHSSSTFGCDARPMHYAPPPLPLPNILRDRPHNLLRLHFAPGWTGLKRDPLRAHGKHPRGFEPWSLDP